MDNSYLHFFTSDAELDHHRRRAMGRPDLPSRRRRIRSPWRREQGVQRTA
jgi:hypothetical protein